MLKEKNNSWNALNESTSQSSEEEHTVRHMNSQFIYSLQILTTQKMTFTNSITQAISQNILIYKWSALISGSVHHTVSSLPVLNTINIKRTILINDP